MAFTCSLLEYEIFIILKLKLHDIVRLTTYASSFPVTWQLKVKWRRVADLPVGMSQHSVVRIGDTIYCGGGFTDGADRQVFQYNPEEDKWTAPFPPCPTVDFGLTHLEGRLVAVGGEEWHAPPITPTNHVCTLDWSQRWTSLPPMPTARTSPTVFTFNAHIISCGGIISQTDGHNYTCTNTVEIFSSDTSQWFTAQPLPMPICSMSPTIIGDTCHLIGGLISERGRSVGCNKSLTASLSGVISSVTPIPSSLPPSHTQSPVWKTVHRCPLDLSAAVELDGQLVAVGGTTRERVHASVHVYIPSSDSWLELADSDLPVPLYWPEATQLSTGQLIVVGGQDDRDRKTKDVFIGTLVTFP